MSKKYYYAPITKKLTNHTKNCKAYWSLLRRFLNNKKTPLIPPLLHENKFVTNFKEKVELFNSHFATRCSLINCCSKLQQQIKYLTGNRRSILSLPYDKIAKLFQNLDLNKVHGHDNISMRMVKVCGHSVYNFESKL